MSNALQNRLVGTIILVAVTVIFLPDYLDGKKQTNAETFVDFPRSTSNLSAVAPDAFPAQEVANATRREVEVINEEASDGLFEQANNGDANTQSQNDDSSARDSSARDSSAQQSEDERRMAEIMANNVKASESQRASDDETPADAAPDENTIQSPPENSLAQQTQTKAASTSANDNAGWVVQLGSFGNQKNVNDLLRKLEKAGYRTFSRKVQTSAGRLTKVFVGPELDKAKLDLALPHLKETTGLTGKVTTFDVVSN